MYNDDSDRSNDSDSADDSDGCSHLHNFEQNDDYKLVLGATCHHKRAH